MIDRWYGFRPKTVDDLPYIGMMPAENNVYAATGHFRNGILLAPATAKMITDLVIGNKVSEMWTNVFDPARECQ
ncbi:FAD-dependent oxidoreductase [Bacillus sp. N9]